MLAIERQQMILKILADKGNVTTAELSTLLSVSPATVRNDLNKLSKDNLINKTHGGATLISNLQKNDTKPEPIPQNKFNFNIRETTNSKEKEAISKQALSYIQNNQCILLDGSSTALALAKKLSKFNNIMVITNGIYTMLALKDLPNVNVIMLGGIVTKNSGSVEGLLGSELLNHVHVDLAFVSANGFTLKEGCTDFNIYEVELKKAMLSNCNKIIALLDSSKFEFTSTASFLPAENINLILTDDGINPEHLKKYQANGINIEICPVD